MRKDRAVPAVRRIAAVAAAIPIAALALAPASAAVGAATSHGLGNRLVAIAARPDLPAQTHEIGTVRSTMEIRGAVGLKVRDQSGLTSFISAVSDRRSPLFHHYLSKGAFASRFGAASSATSAVVGWLRGQGLEANVSSNHILVTFSGSAAHVEHAFGTGLAEYRFANGRTGWGTTVAPRLPAHVAADVEGVAGLDDLVHYGNGMEKVSRSTLRKYYAAHPLPAATKQPHTSGAGPVACSDATAQSVYGGVTDQQLAHAYGVDGLYSAGDTGVGQTVDIFELEPFLQSDVKAFDQCYFGSSTTNYNNVHVEQIDGGAGTGPGEGEAALDVEDVSAIAPGASINVYEAPNSTYGSLDNYNAIAENDDASVVSSSWGLCESAFQSGAPGVQEIESEIFAETAAQGQSVFAAAGDDGSDDCAGHDSEAVPNNLSVDDPSSQTYVTAVGGTSFTNISEPPNEIVWNDGAVWGGGGGGVSDTWAEPSWQAEATVAGIGNAAGTGAEPCSDDPTGAGGDYNLAGEDTTLPSGTPCRLVPDVTGLADEFTGITIYWDGADLTKEGIDPWTTIGGTSSSTPLWAAMTADMDASSSCEGSTLGFISPLLYDVASSGASNYADAFNDITVGNNDNLAVGDGTDFAATSGYDLASGLGSPRITNPDGAPGLAAQACAMVQSSSQPPTVTALSTDDGTSDGGTAVTISGANFGSTAGQVFVGTQAATIVSWSGSSIDITTPAYVAPQGTVLPAAGSAPVTVVTASPERSSALDPDSSVFHYLASGSSGSPVVDYTGPTAGPSTGGTTVDIVGSGFTGATGVTFGGLPATSFTVVNDSNISAVVPAETGETTCANSDPSVCQVQVGVTTPAGTSAASTIEPAYSGTINFAESGVIETTPGTEDVAAPTEFDYAPEPSVTSVTPHYGSEFGGSLEDFHGSGFNVLTYFWTAFGDPSVEFNEDYYVLSITPTDLYVVGTGDPTLFEPTIEPEAQEATIVGSDGDYTVPTDLYALAGTTQVTGLSSHYGSSEGGGTLTITGHGFTAAEWVVFDDTEGAPGGTETNVFTSQSDTSLTAVVPANLPVQTEVFVCTETGCDNPDPAVDLFTFGYPEAPHLSSISPKSGPAAGGELSNPSSIVILKGSYLDSVVAVKFGNVQATEFVNTGVLPGLGAAGGIEVLPPPGVAGSKVKVSVETAGGIAIGSGYSNTLSFTYKPSVPSAPTDLRLSTGKGSLRARWGAPASDGGSSVTGYTVELIGSSGKPVTEKVKASTTSVRFTGLKAGKRYIVEVTASNSKGVGYIAEAGPKKIK